MTSNGKNEEGDLLQNDFIITFDVDWAPDWCILQIADILIKKKIKATWFITHDCQGIRHLRDYPELFELGIHPNFHKDSTQGKQPHEVMDYLMAVVPEARSVRTHGLVQSSHLIKMMAEEYGIQYDVSILLRETPNIVPHTFYTTKESSIIRIPFFWEDDVEMLSPEPVFSFSHPKYHVTGLKAFSFHLITLALNTCSFESYQACKAKTSCITDLTVEQAEIFINHNPGSLTLFNEITDFLMNQEQTGTTISEIGDAFKHNLW